MMPMPRLSFQWDASYTDPVEKSAIDVVPPLTEKYLSVLSSVQSMTPTPPPVPMLRDGESEQVERRDELELVVVEAGGGRVAGEDIDAADEAEQVPDLVGGDADEVDLRSR